jgi:hypothetical protein
MSDSFLPAARSDNHATKQIQSSFPAAKAIGNRSWNSRENRDFRNFERGSIVTDSSDLQSEKHDSQITSTDAGRRIDLRPLPKNAFRSIRDNFEFDSNVMN